MGWFPEAKKRTGRDGLSVFFVGYVANRKEQPHSNLSLEKPILRIDFVFWEDQLRFVIIFNNNFQSLKEQSCRDGRSAKQHRVAQQPVGPKVPRALRQGVCSTNMRRPGAARHACLPVFEKNDFAIILFGSQPAKYGVDTSRFAYRTAPAASEGKRGHAVAGTLSALRPGWLRADGSSRNRLRSNPHLRLVQSTTSRRLKANCFRDNTVARATVTGRNHPRWRPALTHIPPLVPT